MEPVAPAYLDWLPDEALLELLLQTDDLDTLTRWCQTSRRVAGFCQDEGFWHRKYLKDFQDLTPLLQGITWRKRYQRRALSKGLNSPLSTGGFHYGIIDETGALYMTGLNSSGELGNGTRIDSITPQIIPFDSKVIHVSCGFSGTGAITEDGSLYFWGSNQYQIIPNSNQTLFLTPQKVAFYLKAKKVTVGQTSLGVITEDDSVYYWGVISQEKTILVPEKIPIKGRDILIGDRDPLYALLGVDGKIYMWGFLLTDQPNKRFTETPKEIPLPELIQQVCLGEDHAVALSKEGNVYTWGDNSSGQLGLSDDPDLFTDQPRKVNLPKPISFISSSYDTVAAVTRDGELYMWGNGEFGEFSEIDGGSSGFNFPVQIDIGSSVNYVSVGGTYIIAVTKNGVVNYWGNPDYQPA